MKRIHVLIMGLAALLMGAFFLLFEVVEEDIDTGPQGMARINPFHAVDLFLDEMGIETDSRFNLDTTPDTDRVLLLFAEDRTFRERVADDLAQWVHQGGHLILYVPPIDGSSDPIVDAIVADAHRFVHRNVSDHDRDVRGLDASMAPLDSVNMPIFDACWWPDDPSKCSVARVHPGRGHLTLVGDVSWLRHTHLGDNDHARLLWALVHTDNTSPKRALIIVRGGAPSLWSLLWNHGWPVVISLALWLLVWLWRALTRVVPVQSTRAPVRQRLLEHIEASGAMLWRLDHQRVLQQSVRDAIDGRQLARLLATTRAREGSQPAVDPDDTDSLSAALASDLGDPDAFTNTMQQAQRLWITPHDRSSRA